MTTKGTQIFVMVLPYYEGAPIGVVLTTFGNEQEANEACAERNRNAKRLAEIWKDRVAA